MSNFSLNSRAVRRYLVRALTGDTERPRPPITLAGQRPSTVLQPGVPPAPSTPPVWTGDLRNRSRATSGAAEAEPGDEQGAYSREQLIRMDHRFRTRLLRAFERGHESRTAATAMYDGRDRVGRFASSDS
jgi:hypothetical protein